MECKRISQGERIKTGFEELEGRDRAGEMSKYRLENLNNIKQ